MYMGQVNFEVKVNLINVNQGFEYLTPKLRIDADDLTVELLASLTFHLVGTPTRAISMVNNIMSRRKEQGIKGRPMFLWEPVPGRCSPEEWNDCIKAMELVDVISPNVNEASGFLGKIVDEEQPFENFKVQVEEISREYVSHQIGLNGAAVLRCGKHGCFVATRTEMKWLPAYHQSPEKVVDPTGGGNAFCGGFCVGWVRSGGDFIKAAEYGSIAASFIIEQYGLPRLEVDCDGEKWNGNTIKCRQEAYRKLCG